jgi:hypothetical protein
MADKAIHNAVRLDTPTGEGVTGHTAKVYNPGMEEALATEATPEQLKHLTKQGAISGFVATAKKEEAKAPTPPAK